MATWYQAIFAEKLVPTAGWSRQCVGHTQGIVHGATVCGLLTTAAILLFVDGM
jgi:hypothetical protein